MKYNLLFLLLFPAAVLAQDCKLQRETDPFTKLTKLSTGFIFLDGGSISFDGDKKEIDVLLSVEGADKCFDDNSTAFVFFEGSKVKMTIRNGGTMNCEGLFHFIYRNTASTSTLLQKLTTQKISKIVFTGSNKKETIVNVGPKEQDAIIKLGTCLVNEAKTLIQ